MAPSLQSDTRQMKSRRVSKHLTERKRRARINDSLLQLKTIVYPALKNEVVQNSKMEKADILDMTLRYVKDIQQKNREGKDPEVDQFHAGYSECLSQVSSYLTSCEAMPLETRRRLLTHLADKSLSGSAMGEPHHPAPLSPTVSPSSSPRTHRVPPLPIASPGVVYLLPAQALQPISQTAVVTAQSQGSAQTLAASHVVSILPTPPHSPISVKQQSPPGIDFYQTASVTDASLVTPSIVPMVTVSTPVSSAGDSNVWRPW